MCFHLSLHFCSNPKLTQSNSTPHFMGSYTLSPSLSPLTVLNLLPVITITYQPATWHIILLCLCLYFVQIPKQLNS